MSSPPCFQAVATYLLLLLMRQQNVTLPQRQRRQMNNSLVENTEEWSTIQAPAEQVTQSATAGLLVCSCHECRFEVVTSIVILLKDYAMLASMLNCSAGSHLGRYNIAIRMIWSCKNALGSHFRTNYIRMYVCWPDTCHLTPELI